MVYQHFIAGPAGGFSCIPLAGGGYSWTLTSQLSQMLSEAETRFGPRDKKWTPVGIEFCGNIPHVWYPGNRNHVAIMLSDSARENPRNALFQLSHEVIHLLAPTGNNQTTVIDEGLATLFSNEISVRYGLGYNYDHVPSYVAAEKLTKLLIQAYPDGIKQIREKEMYLSNFTPELVLGVCPDLSREVAEQLCQPFVRGQ